MICVGLLKLNENVRREKFVLPTIDNILHKVAVSSVYLTPDAASIFCKGAGTFAGPKGTGAMTEEHDRHLKKVMEIIPESGLELNHQKCKTRQSSLQFLGHVISQDGIAPCPQRESAIPTLEPPKNVSKLKRVLGMVNCVGNTHLTYLTLMEAHSSL